MEGPGRHPRTPAVGSRREAPQATADAPQATGDPPRFPAVWLRVHGRRIELRFAGGFTEDDVATVKAIAGRRWHPDHLVWTLPNTPRTMQTLSRALGPRLVVTGPTRPAGEPAELARPSPERARGTAGVPGAVPPASERATPADADTAAPPADANTAATPRPGEGGGLYAHLSEAEALFDMIRKTLRTREYSPKTEAAYVAWARRFVRFCAGDVDRVEELDGSHARAFLEYLATEKRLAAGSRNQAASALGFMFREVLGRDELADVPRAKGPKRAPMVLTHREVLRVLRELTGKYFLIAVLLYSAGLRLEECLRLRVKDIDFELRQILVRDGKGQKDRYVPLARRAMDLLRAQIRRVAELNEKDRADGHGWAALPGALHRKDPGAGYELGWQYVFPASTMNTDPATDRAGRLPLHATAVQREVKAAVRRSGIPKRATCHTFRHSFATEALRGGCDIRTLQHVMGHKDLRTTTIYLHVVEQTGLHLRSPLDRPDDPDDYDPPPIGRPWSGTQKQWELGARQWSGGEPAED